MPLAPLAKLPHQLQRTRTVHPQIAFRCPATKVALSMSSTTRIRSEPEGNFSLRWVLTIAFAGVWGFGNWTQDIGGFKGTMSVSGFPFVFASSGDLIEPSFSLTALTCDILTGLAIFVAIVAIVPKKAHQQPLDQDSAE